jgi:sugar/nucleoside kinase (ribokinase family)
MRDYEVVFIGHTTYDILGILKKDVSPLRTNQLSRWEYSFGGKAANAAVYCADAGARTAYVGVVGNDFRSIGYEEYLRSSSVNVDNVFYLDQKTPVYSAFTYKDKTYAFLQPAQYSDSQLVELREHFGRYVKVLPAKILYCAFNDHSSVLDVFRLARTTGKQTAWNPLFSALDAELERSILNETDFLFINEKEALTLKEQLGLELNQYYEAFGTSVICNTQGSKGCKLIVRGQVKHIPGIKAESVIDPTGAGDAFAGTFLAATTLSTFKTFESCAKHACQVASLVVGKLGTQNRKADLISISI